MTYSDYNIIIPNGKYTGQVYTICPKCSHERKKKTDKCLGVNLDKQVWHCNHCNWKGWLPKQIAIDEKVYVKPEWKNKTDLSDKAIKWFEKRGLDQKTISDWKISEGVEWMPQTQKDENTIQFNYFDENEELINIKYRDARKNFKLHKDAKLIFYGLNLFKFDLNAFLVEGEVDALSMYKSGYKNVLSVPNGANVSNNNLQYFDYISERFNETPTIYLCFDNDNAGRQLTEEFATRLGKEKCKLVTFKDCKDANECLQKYGIQGIIESIQDAKDYPLEGVFTIQDMENEIFDLYENGLDRGVNIGFDKFDRLLTFVKGYITTITGIPGHGKSDFVDEMVIRLMLGHGWKTAFFSPENKPTKLHFSKLARKIIGKSWDSQYRNRMNDMEVKMAMKSMNEKVWFIKPEKDFTLESILEHIKNLKIRFGLDAFVIDAWNKLEHKYNQSETKYIGESLEKLSIFCEQYNLHCFLVAHPRKINKDKQTGKYEIPNLYDIAGSSNFYNKTDNGISVYRTFENKTFVYVQKVKFSHWGTIGQSEYTYDLSSGRYIEDGTFHTADSWVTIEQATMEENKEFLNDKEPF
jgi:twinkle protein